MGAATGIEWTDATWNPVRGCSRVSPGCGGPNHEGGCYAEKIAARFSDPGQPFHGYAERTRHGGRWTGAVALIEDALALPLTWKKPRRVFVNSMSDLFHESLPDAAIDKIFAVMALCPRHTFQVLTKRAQRMRDYAASLTIDRLTQVMPDIVESTKRSLSARLVPMWLGRSVDLWRQHYVEARCRGLPVPNVWFGVSVEDQPRADERIPFLLETRAAVRFLSCEPLLSPVALRVGPNQARPTWCRALRSRGVPRVDWVICGGESGPRARPMHPAWARSLRDQCTAAGVPFFFKQWGEHEPAELIGDDRPEPWRRTPSGQEIWAFSEWAEPRTSLAPVTFARVGKARAGRLLDGREWNEFPGQARKAAS